MTRSLTISLSGDVLTQPLGRLAGALPDFAVTVRHHEIDQLRMVLAQPSDSDVLISHATADFFRDGASDPEAEQRMDDYCAAVTAFAAANRTLVILNTLEQWPARIVGMRYFEALALIGRLNGRLVRLASEVGSVSLIDVGGIVAGLGASNALSMQNRLAMRMPYTRPMLEALTSAYAQAIRERFAPRKKVIVVDADNTLWGGIVGEDGFEGIAIDQQYPGTLFRRFQQQLLELRDTGLLLALVSKNNLADVEEVFRVRDMPLKLEHFSAVQVNWEPKSENITRIAHTLNVGVDSMVFIDDNPFELEQVSAALPDVEVYPFDARRADQALGLLGSVPGLKAWAITEEDVAKAAQYEQERERSALKQGATSLEEYLRSLDIHLEIGRNRAAHIKRISQLTNKTNQFNLTTRRYSELDIARLMQEGSVYDVRLRDRFGDMGIIAVVIVVDQDIDTFLMSCRALGRNVESTILAFVGAKEGGGLTASYLPTRKNMMTADFFDSNGFELVEETAAGKRYRSAALPRPSAEITLSEVD